jgi:hypothetical protein
MIVFAALGVGVLAPLAAGQGRVNLRPKWHRSRGQRYYAQWNQQRTVIRAESAGDPEKPVTRAVVSKQTWGLWREVMSAETNGPARIGLIFDRVAFSRLGPGARMSIDTDLLEPGTRDSLGRALMLLVGGMVVVELDDRGRVTAVSGLEQLRAKVGVDRLKPEVLEPIRAVLTEAWYREMFAAANALYPYEQKALGQTWTRAVEREGERCTVTQQIDAITPGEGRTEVAFSWVGDRAPQESAGAEKATTTIQVSGEGVHALEQGLLVSMSETFEVTRRRPQPASSAASAAVSERIEGRTSHKLMTRNERNREKAKNRKARDATQ